MKFQMRIKLFNTLTRKIEEFTPLKHGEVKLYTCGPTVYDHQTIGNLRTYVLYDTLKRVLEYADYKVDHVMNITDVGHLTSDADEGEDKLEKGAKKAGKTVWEVAEAYVEEFRENLRQLNISEPALGRATEFVPQQISMVEILLDNGYAYQTSQAIYFDVSKPKEYGRLTGQKLSDKEVGARPGIVVDREKRHPQDFALWFFLVGRFENHEMNWPSPWGKGFPGWHLECSAIIHSTLGDPIDIHSGAVDLIGTHHTNEMAQSEAAFDNQLANYWVHGEHLLVDGQRMGKSLGNFYILEDVIRKGFDPLSLRLLFLQAHYRSQLNFTWESLAASQSFLRRLRAWADLSHQPKIRQPVRSDLMNKVEDSLAGDINTAQALATISQQVDISAPSATLLGQLDQVFGLGLSHKPDITASQKQIISDREAARQQNNWPKADELRNQLAASGIEIEDSANGPIWHRAA